MRSKAFSFLLSLSLMFCVGFGSSLHAYAVSPEFLGDFVLWHGNVTPYVVISRGNTAIYNKKATYETGTANDNKYRDFLTDNGNLSGVTSIKIFHDQSGIDFLYVPEVYDYYLAIRVWSGVEVSNFTFVPDYNVALIDNCYNTSGQYEEIVLQNDFIHFDGGLMTGFQTVSKLPDNLNGNINGFTLYGSAGTLGNNLHLQVYIIPVEKSSSGGSDLSAQILNELQKINSNIEDQYSGDPGSSFPVDDIITQHNEKMGVLSFSSDALMQVLGLLSPDQTLSSELVFPSMSLTIAGQRNKVQLWPEYRFDLNTLKQHWPNFVELMQSLTSALVWIFVLRYCYRVFEKYFLAGGGS